MDNYHLGYSLLYDTGVEKSEKVKFFVLVKNPTQFYLITKDCDNFENLDTRFGNKRWALEKYNLKEEDLLRLEKFKITPVLFDKLCGLEIKWKFGITSKGPAVKVARILFDHIKEQHQPDAPIVTDIFDVNLIKNNKEAGKLTGQGQVEPLRQPISSIKKKPNSTRASEKTLSSSEEVFSSITATSRPKNSKKKVHFLSKEFKLKQVEDQEKESTPVTELSKRQCFLKARDHINGQAIQERLGITKKIPKKEASSLEKREKRTSFIKAREQINEQTRFNITPTELKEEKTVPGIVHPRSRVETDEEASHAENTGKNNDTTIENNYELTQNAVTQQFQLPTGNIGQAVQYQTCSKITSTQEQAYPRLIHPRERLSNRQRFDADSATVQALAILTNDSSRIHERNCSATVNNDTNTNIEPYTTSLMVATNDERPNLSNRHECVAKKINVSQSAAEPGCSTEKHHEKFSSKDAKKSRKKQQELDRIATLEQKLMLDKNEIERKKLEKRQKEEDPLKMKINLKQLKPLIDSQVIEESIIEEPSTNKSQEKKRILKAKRRLESKVTTLQVEQQAPSNLQKGSFQGASGSWQIEENHSLSYSEKSNNADQSRNNLTTTAKTDEVSLAEAINHPFPAHDFNCETTQSHRSTSSDFDSDSDGPYTKEFADFLRNRVRDEPNDKVRANERPIKKLTKRRSKKKAEENKKILPTAPFITQESTQDIKREEIEERTSTTVQIEQQPPILTPNITSELNLALNDQKPETKKQIRHRRRLNQRRRVFMFDDSSSDDEESENESPRSCHDEKSEAVRKNMEGLKELRQLLMKEAQITSDIMQECAEANKNLSEDLEDSEKLDRLKKWIRESQTGLDTNDEESHIGLDTNDDAEEVGYGPRDDNVEAWRPFRACANCGTFGYHYWCNSCHLVFYCNETCQLQHWNAQHEKQCPGDGYVTTSSEDKQSNDIKESEKGSEKKVCQSRTSEWLREIRGKFDCD